MVELQIEGMNCNRCAIKVTKAVKEIDANAKVDVDLKNKKVCVETTAEQADIRSAIIDAGYVITGASTA